VVYKKLIFKADISGSATVHSWVVADIRRHLFLPSLHLYRQKWKILSKC